MVATYEHELTVHAPPLSGQALLEDLSQRLERGLAIIEQRASSGQPVSKLEDHWISLLGEYEELYNSIA